MASIVENDGAITKASFVLMEIAKMDTDLDVRFSKETVSHTLIVEGGQGFLPTHSIEDIKARLNSAMLRAVEEYESRRETIEKKPVMTFDKLHNDAFDRDPESPSILDAMLCAKCAGISPQSPILGWNASCDARLFAHECPGLEIITTGPGKISYAHSDNEQITVEELAQSCAMLTLFLLVHTDALTIDNSII
jgi:acetylornithine deacetylase/succinyl-diaminopimelate desuccinylase-like protein